MGMLRRRLDSYETDENDPLLVAPPVPDEPALSESSDVSSGDECPLKNAVADLLCIVHMHTVEDVWAARIAGLAMVMPAFVVSVAIGVGLGLAMH